MKKPKFAKNHIYHIYNRGVEKRNIFIDDDDRQRFIHYLFELNDKENANNLTFYFNQSAGEIEPSCLKKERRPRKLLVEILAFVIMPNHYHLLLKEREDGGIVKFMQKLGTGYSMYFNKKYERVGGLFQGRFKAVLINKDAHFMYLPHYIHLNPLYLNYGGSTSIVKKLDFLKNYRWSSFPDYVGKKNFPSVTSRAFLLDFFGGSEKYKKDIENWLKNKEKYQEKDSILKRYDKLTLEQ